MNFELTTEFFIMIGLFLTITFMITIIIVYFLTKVKTLSSFLGEAKEIDEAKNEKISALEIQLQEEKIYNINIMSELKNFEKNRETLSQRERDIIGLKENINLQSQEHIKTSNYQEMSFKKLKSEHEILNDNYDNLIERYKLLQKRNETLVKEHNVYHTRLRKTEAQLNEKEKKKFEKVVASVKENSIESKKISTATQGDITSTVKPLDLQADNLKK